MTTGRSSPAFELDIQTPVKSFLVTMCREQPRSSEWARAQYTLELRRSGWTDGADLPRVRFSASAVEPANPDLEKEESLRDDKPERLELAESYPATPDNGAADLCLDGVTVVVERIDGDLVGAVTATLSVEIAAEGPHRSVESDPYLVAIEALP